MHLSLKRFISGDELGDNFATNSGYLGDIDGDGKADFVIGANSRTEFTFTEGNDVDNSTTQWTQNYTDQYINSNIT